LGASLTIKNMCVLFYSTKKLIFYYRIHQC